MSFSSKLISNLGTTRAYHLYKHLETSVVRMMSTSSMLNGHSQVPLFHHGDFVVQPVPVFSDNYAYIIYDLKTHDAALVDPADAAEVQRALEEFKLPEEIVADTPTPLNVKQILTTHKHSDHAGGNVELLQKYSHLQVVGGKHDSVAACTKTVDHGDKLEIGQQTKVNVVYIPCHTRGHVAYIVESSRSNSTDSSTSSSSLSTSAADNTGGFTPIINHQFKPALFCGDTLFTAGVGKFFEGSADEMYKNLKLLASLDDHTVVYHGHEYTLSNLEFAQWVEPDNADIRKKLQWAQERRKRSITTLATTIGEEKKINPFMRAVLADSYPSISKRIASSMKNKNFSAEPGESSMIALVGAVREAKNSNLHK